MLDIVSNASYGTEILLFAVSLGPLACLLLKVPGVSRDHPAPLFSSELNSMVSSTSSLSDLRINTCVQVGISTHMSLKQEMQRQSELDRVS